MKAEIPVCSLMYFTESEDAGLKLKNGKKIHDPGLEYREI